jgi:hypothetical protein
MQEANLLGLQEMKNTPDTGAEDLKDQGMAMGAKMGGFDPVNRLGRIQPFLGAVFLRKQFPFDGEYTHQSSVSTGNSAGRHGHATKDTTGDGQGLRMGIWGAVRLAEGCCRGDFGHY